MKQQDNKKMRALYDQWLISGKSRAYFAKSHGISPNTFNYWVNKFQGSLVVKKAGNFKQLSAGTPIPVNTSTPSAVIHFPGGARIELYHRPEVCFLKELLF